MVYFSEVCELDFQAAEMILMTLTTHGGYRQLVSIGRSIS